MSAKNQEAAYRTPQPFAPSLPPRPKPDRSPERIRELLMLVACRDQFSRLQGEWGLRGLGLTADEASVMVEDMEGSIG